MDNREITRPLVQAPMESPLNLAHMFSRRADMLTKNRKYEEALSCHRKAAECLLQAMHTASCPTLLDSLALQHKVYLSQIERLQAKSQLFELMDRNNKTTATISRATQTDSIHTVETSEQTTIDEDEIYQTLRENDDLLNRIGLRNLEKSDCSQLSIISYKSSILSEGDAVDVINNDKSTVTSKMLKPDGTTLGDGFVSMEEIVKMNEKLSQAVRSLLQDLGSTKAEKKQMEEKLGESQEILRQGSEALTFSSLNLPPLEASYPELANFNIQS
ncbi:unnamed protein product [Candidula unifasciata]|uniref:Nuclear receptor-binding factor 2 MIT domain-containing protein n=1 Tax=Candidula unifasciata TaxID=100452 RepID=A0A8S3YT08_9EUPU|nr:unnamed protein product [Candidula unifasciata]